MDDELVGPVWGAVPVDIDPGILSHLNSILEAGNRRVCFKNVIVGLALN